MNILHAGLIELTYIMCALCGFWRSLPFKLTLPLLFYLL